MSQLLALVPMLRDGNLKAESDLSLVNYSHLFRLYQLAMESSWHRKDLLESLKSACSDAVQAAQVSGASGSAAWPFCNSHLAFVCRA